ESDEDQSPLKVTGQVYPKDKYQSTQSARNQVDAVLSQRQCPGIIFHRRVRRQLPDVTGRPLIVFLKPASIADLLRCPVIVVDLIPNETGFLCKRYLPAFRPALNLHSLCQILGVFQREGVEKTTDGSP